VSVPRTSRTQVATWFWQTKGRNAEHVVLGVRLSEFILLEFQSPSRRIFIGSHSLPPLWLPNRSFNWYQSQFGSLLTLASLRSKDGVPGTGRILWDVTVDTGYVQMMNFLTPGSRDMFDANNKVVDYLFRALCLSEFDQVHTEHLACRIWSVLKEAHVGNAQVQARMYATYGESTRTSLISPVSPSMPCFRGSQLW
jgi:hypothetical protein